MNRLVLLLLASSLFLAAFAVPPAGAGSQSNPEVVGKTGNQQLSPFGKALAPPCTPAGSPVADCEFSPSNILSGWVNETATNLTFSFNLALSPTSSQSSNIVTYFYSFNFQVGNKTYAATATFNNILNPNNPPGPTSTPIGDGKITAGGVASSAALVGPIVNLTVPKSAVGNVTTGAVLSHLSIDSGGYLLGTVSQLSPGPPPPGGTAVLLVSDHAPGTGFGRNYTVMTGVARPSGSGSGSGTSSTTTTGTGTSSSTSSSSSGPSSSSSSSTSGSTAPSSTTSGTTSSSTPSSSTSQSALDKVQADAGYAVASAAAMGAVVLISLVGLFGRWGA